jgi:osmotically-inducible protein OsmY
MPRRYCRSLAYVEPLVCVLLAVAVLLVGAGMANAQNDAGALDDARINAAVEAALAQAPSLEPRRIRVLTLAGTVYLSGSVRSMEEFAIAATAAWSVDGVIAVRNALRVEQPESTA